MIDPEIVFSEWQPWSERYSIPRIEEPGLYVLARFDSKPSGPVNPIDSTVVYIGESTKRTISNRLYEFNRSAFENKNGHSAGWTYCSLFADQGAPLFVAAFPVSESDIVARNAFIHFCERKLIWEYVKLWGRLPSCNTK